MLNYDKVWQIMIKYEKLWKSFKMINVSMIKHDKVQ